MFTMNRITSESIRSVAAALLCFVAILSCSPGASAASQTPPGVARLLDRIFTDSAAASRFDCRLVKADGPEAFTVSCDGSTVTVEGSSVSAITSGINHFLRRHMGITLGWGNMKAALGRELPVVSRETVTATVPVRYYLNFCTHSYSMAFWDWDRWQQELDWMALRGINAPLITEGFECVWADLLGRTYGYDAVGSFLPGPAHFAWFYMNNLTGCGGPLTDGWYESHLTMARDIFARAAELGMTPVVPGYSGMIPSDFLSRADSAAVAVWQPSDIAPTGKWCSFVRPAIVTDGQRLAEMAAQYYRSVDRLFGDVLRTPYFALDPFHEGGVVPEGFDCSSAVGTMWTALTDYRPDAVWVAQHWQDNPRTFLTHTVPNGRLLILDLHGDSKGSAVCDGNSTDAQGRPHRWVYGALNNFGGNVGLFGRVQRIASSLSEALAGARENNLVGIGLLPEGIENNPVLFDMVCDYAWSDGVVPSRADTWLEGYIASRYGLERGSQDHAVALKAWRTIFDGIYNCDDVRQQGTTESVMMMRPAAAPATVSAWASSSWYWDRGELREAARMLASLAPRLSSNANFRYDLVDVTRQCLADRACELLAAGPRPKDMPDRFMRLISLQDRLLATHPAFRLSTWTEMARSHGRTAAESDSYERNARLLLTTWGGREASEAGQLHDYANREWSGLLTAFYAPRWRRYFDAPADTVDWFAEYGQPFVEGRSVPYGTFRNTPSADPVITACLALELLDRL